MNRVTKDFIRLFNEREDFYECHEIFEEAWKTADDPIEKTFYKALVQVATAQFKLKKGVLRGVGKLFESAYPLLRILPDTVQGIDLVKLREDFAQQVRSLPDRDFIQEGEYRRYGIKPVKIYPADGFFEEK